MTCLRFVLLGDWGWGALTHLPMDSHPTPSLEACLWGLISSFCRPLSRFPWCGESKGGSCRAVGGMQAHVGDRAPELHREQRDSSPGLGRGALVLWLPPLLTTVRVRSASPGGLCRLLGEVRPVSGLPPLCWHPNSALGCVTLDCPPTASVRCPLSSSRHGVHKDKGWGCPGLSTWQELCKPGLLA